LAGRPGRGRIAAADHTRSMTASALNITCGSVVD
jgi:hypothetical protein